MESTAPVWMIGTISLVVGVLLGVVVYRLFQSDSGKKEQLTEELTQVKAEQEQYQKDVRDHFLETAQLINNLNQSYKAVHEHLAQGANSLCDPHDAATVLEAADMPPRLETDENPIIESESDSDLAEDQAPQDAETEEAELNEEYEEEDSTPWPGREKQSAEMSEDAAIDESQEEKPENKADSPA